MSRTIELRVLGFNRSGVFQFICLETDIAVTSDTLAGAKSKISDAVVSYFQSFSEKEIEDKAFMRKAPLRYRVGWKIIHFASFIKRITFFDSSEAEYNPSTHAMILA